ncbi:hypothetical protein EB796_020870 [Bugula neritina]|uniref:Uncharacterized protein n=1 Tax=Bugula neritina TaxID=10212 RepID=A0A7J7J3Z3_BUGNE|nr:hypothetical protein EB796_020870 [Bugula neritina]
MWSEINGATFQDLMSLTNSNYGALSQAISMKCVGCLSGCILGGGYIVNGMHGGLCSAKCIVIPFCHYIVGFGCISDL